MNPIQIFYSNPYFEGLQETQPFKKYLEREEEKIKSCGIRGKVLDIGCGNGRSTELLAKFADYVVGVDFSERLLEQANQKRNAVWHQKVGGANWRYYLEDAKSLHFEDSSFDIVGMFWNTFGNLYSSRDQVLRETKRVLKPNGRIIMSVFAENILPAYLELLSSNELRVSQQDENYVFLREGLVSERFSRIKLEQICKSVGLNPKIEQLTDVTYWCEATK
jgi:ubiquinone/menaquinone biosynthesis C-methylase UbiE